MKGKPDFQWCKKCGQGNERTDGSNHVPCLNQDCGFNMCILCGGEWSDKLGIANGYCYSYKCKVYGKDRKDWNWVITVNSSAWLVNSCGGPDTVEQDYYRKLLHMN